MKKKYLSVLGLAPLALLAACSSTPPSYKIIDAPTTIDKLEGYDNLNKNTSVSNNELTISINYIDEIIFKMSHKLQQKTLITLDGKIVGGDENFSPSDSKFANAEVTMLYQFFVLSTYSEDAFKCSGDVMEMGTPNDQDCIELRPLQDSKIYPGNSAYNQNYKTEYFVFNNKRAIRIATYNLYLVSLSVNDILLGELLVTPTCTTVVKKYGEYKLTTNINQ